MGQKLASLRTASYRAFRGSNQSPARRDRPWHGWSDDPATSGMGQRRRSKHVRDMSAYPPIPAGYQTSRQVGSVRILLQNSVARDWRAIIESWAKNF